jgi:phosphotransferase system enzyme I (PtsI)
MSTHAASPTQLFSGIGVGESSAWGKTFVLAPRPKVPAEAKSSLGQELEKERLVQAIAFVSNDLSATSLKADKTTAEILDALLTLVGDPALIEEAEVHLAQGWNAETSVIRAMNSFTDLLAGDDLFSERIADLKDLALQIVARLTGQDRSISLPNVGPIVVIAEDLSPAETALFTDAVVAVITSGGGPTSHTAIICRQRNIPALVAVKNATEISNDVGLVVDAGNGQAYLAASSPELNAKGLQRSRTGAAIAEVKGNVGSVQDAIALALTEASGIGLMRTELLFLGRSAAPSFEEQTELYSAVLDKAPLGEVIFRTLDAGSDKPLPYLGIGIEENPSLGVRGYRINEVDESILDIQLKALYKAQTETGRSVSVMAPMIATVQEAKEFATMARSHGISTVGIMVETPSICVLLPELAGVVDFVSIGTNDLSQYLFAADRQNSKVANLLNPWQPALLKTIARACEDAKLAGIKIGVCGEAAADPLLAVVLAGLGVHSVSMASPAVKRVSDYLCSVSMEQAQAIAKAALTGSSPIEAKQLAMAQLPG